MYKWGGRCRGCADKNYAKNRKVRKDLSGQRVGKLLIIEVYERRLIGKDNHSTIYYKCLCDCGKECIVNVGALRGEYTKSCGCGNFVNRKSYGESSLNRVFKHYKKDAKKRGYEFNISIDFFKVITQQDCEYCGISPNNTCLGTGSFGEYRYNGIDRVDNEIGYLESNVVPCCKDCNIAKRAMTKEQFINWVCRVYTYSQKATLKAV